MDISQAAPYAGPGIRLAQKEDFDAFDPDWPTKAPSNTIQNFAFDERNPKRCYVCPPAGDYAYVELVYVADPTDCADGNSPLGVDDQYAAALRYLTLAICYEKEIEGANPARSQYYYGLAQALLDGAEGKDLATSPNVSDEGGAVPKRLGGA